MKTLRVIVDDDALERFQTLSALCQEPLDSLASWVFLSGLQYLTDDARADAPSAFRWWLELRKNYTRRSATVYASNIRAAINRHTTLDAWIEAAEMTAERYRRAAVGRVWFQWCALVGHPPNELDVEATLAAQQRAADPPTGLDLLEG